MKKNVIMGYLVLIIICVILIMPYGESASLCKLIETGQSEVAIKKIERMKDVNCSTAPVFIKPILNSVEYSVDLPLIVACKMGDYQIVEALLRKGADPDKYYEGGFTAGEAVFVGNTYHELEILQLLIAYGADVTNSASGTTPLFCAAQKMVYSNGERKEYFSKCVEFLLKHDDDLVDEKGYSLLFYAVWSNSSSLIQYLLKNEKQLINLPANNGRTVLFDAVERNSFETVKVLIDNGADPNVIDSEGRTACEYAFDNEYYDIATFLESK